MFSVLKKRLPNVYFDVQFYEQYDFLQHLQQLNVQEVVVPFHFLIFRAVLLFLNLLYLQYY
ncbi:unnamed protein product [Schistosoma mattheei]|uniref:Uncharacterized protein n=1 Tax=Schistosoma mattheei TaxID=31246 RepID=A0A3P8H2R2_9TREM|nr:unnamed protein product [Schistosoma mattheei]